MNASSQNRFDVAVVGAGPAGSATARRLAQLGCHVALIERSVFETPRIGESLAPDVQPLLREIGVWESFLALSPIPSWGTRSAWGEDPVSQTHSHLISPWGCGWHVDRAAFDKMLADAASSAGAHLLSGAPLHRCTPLRDGWSLTLVRGSVGGQSEMFEVSARVVIDATGRGANVAQRLGAQRLLLDHLVGITVFFQMSRPTTTTQGYVLVESAKDGWWYTAPLPNHRMVATLMTDADLCQKANLQDSEAWFSKMAFTNLTKERIKEFVGMCGPQVFSSMSQRLRRPVDPAPWLAVGDAALAVDPISGSGVVRALKSARSAAEAAIGMIQADPSDSIMAYETKMDDECTRYLQERALYYLMEPRWREFEFWSRRSKDIELSREEG